MRVVAPAASSDYIIPRMAHPYRDTTLWTPSESWPMRALRWVGRILAPPTPPAPPTITDATWARIRSRTSVARHELYPVPELEVATMVDATREDLQKLWRDGPAILDPFVVR